MLPEPITPPSLPPRLDNESHLRNNLNYKNDNSPHNRHPFSNLEMRNRIETVETPELRNRNDWDGQRNENLRNKNEPETRSSVESVEIRNKLARDLRNGFSNDLRSPNNNSGLPRTRASLVLSPTSEGVNFVVDNKRRSWCGTPSSGVLPPFVRRYGELGHFKPRNDAFLEPYLQNLATRRHTPPGTNGPTTPSPPPNNNNINNTHRTSVPNSQAMAPNSRALDSCSRSVSRESLVSSRGGGGSEASSEGSEEEGYGVTCDIGLMERLVLTHPIWFLPSIQRAGAFHLLQGKDEGCFVVRKSSQSDTMALSVRLPPDKGPYIEHYLIHSSEGRLGLETSENRFVNMAALIAHYSACCDELPVQLTLPKQIRESKSRQQLSSLALLGQEFWSYSPPPSAASSPNADLVLNLNPLMSTFKSTQSANEATTPVSGQTAGSSKPARPNTLNLLSKNDPNRTELMRSMNSLKGGEVSRTPPPPPPRWSKPTTPQQPPANNFTVTTTVTFSVNSQSPSNEKPPSQIELVSCDPKRMSPEGQCNNSTISSRDSLSRRHPITSPQSVLSPNSVMSPCSDAILSPDTLSPLSVLKQGSRSSKRKQKISKHYQESDIVDSPTMLYYKSGLGDKISDYEDVWNNDGHLIKPLVKHNNNGSSNLASPDLLQHTLGNDASRNGSDSSRHITSLNSNVLSPTDSSHNSSLNKSYCSTPIQSDNTQNGVAKVGILSPLLANSNHHSQSMGNLDSPTTQPVANKQASPFYAEPADSLSSNSIHQVSRRLVTRPAPGVPVHHRHSNPPGLGTGKILNAGLDRVEDLTDFNGGIISTSVDNLSPKQKFMGLKKPEVKPVLPPFVKPKNNNDSWQVDNSWKFVTNDGDISMDSSEADYDSDWPNVPNLLTSLETFVPDTDTERTTLQDLISKRFPDIRTSDMSSGNNALHHRMSAYDNVEDRLIIPKAPPSEISEMTDFSEPWAEVCHGTTETETETYSENTLTPSITPTPMKVASIKKSRSFRDRLDPLLAAPRVEALRNSHSEAMAIGTSIRAYALELSQDKSTTFAQNIDNFIACTCESKETNPQVVMRNMRQFMSGMKNYLVKHGEKEFYREIERERNKLKSTEFLNLDAILEGVMHRLVVKPLRNHLQQLFLEHYEKTGAIKLLAENIQYASTRPISELAINPSIKLPSEEILNRIQQFLQRLQQSHSPLEKLENLLAATALIFNSAKSSHTGSGKCFSLGAEDFLPLFVWILVQTNFVAAEIEAEYMWGLLHPSLLSGESGYYLTTLSSAVHVLKNFKDNGEDNAKSQAKNESVLKVVVPDELHGSILTKTLPARPHMTTKEVCKIIAHKARITNPQDYALYRLTDGEETILLDNECPQDFVQNKDGKHTMLVYKRIDAKIAWPPQDKFNV